MGKWRTHEERLAYYRAYNKKYRQEHPEKVNQFQTNTRRKRMDDKTKKEMEERHNHRATFLLDEYDEGIVI